MTDLMVIAHDTAEMAVAQKTLVAWAEGKVAESRAEYNEMAESLDVAKKNKWRQSGLLTAVRNAGKKQSFYEKIKTAVEAGYIIVPNFPIDVFAIRTERRIPLPKTSEYRFADYSQASEAPLAGEGEYRSPDPTLHKMEWKETGKGGEIVAKQSFIAKEFQDVLMPFKAVKPTLMKDVEQAMVKKLFDEIGIAPQVARKDPMLIGQIIYKPTGHRVSFLIAWWLSPSDLEV